MTDPAPPILSLSDDALQHLLKNAIRNSLILGLLIGVALAISSGWGTGALFASGALVSAASIYEWRRLVRLINSRMRAQSANEGAPRRVGLAVAFILLRLVIFGAVI